MYWDGNNYWPVRKIPVQVVEEDESASPDSAKVEQLDEEVETIRKPSSSVSDEVASSAAGEPDWQALALRLQADMANFRRRQALRADEAIAAERERLLRLILSVADNLARALSHDGQSDETLRQGIELTYRELMRLLESEGVTRIETVGQPFTPELHEAVAAIPADAESGTVVEELAAGYKLGDKLLRPARVVVAA